MSEIKISLQVGENQNHLHLKEVSEETLKHITQTFFAAAGVEIFEDSKRGEVQQSDNANEISKSKKLPLIGSHRSLNVSLGEKLQEALGNESKPEFFKTGIKIDDDGTKRYKCRYWCSCGNQSNRYIPLGTELIYCHECNNAIEVEDATFESDEHGIPIRDDYGNFFVARQVVKTGET